MNSGVITSPGASSGTPGGYAQTYSAEVRPTACCSANAVCGAKKRLCDGTGGWAGGGQHLRRGGQGSVLRRRSIDHQQGGGKTVKGGFFIAGGGHGQHVGTTGHFGFKLPVPAQQFRQGGAGQPGSSTVDEDLAGIVGKKPGWAETSSIPWQSTRRRRSGRTAPLNRCKRARQAANQASPCSASRPVQPSRLAING